MLGLTQEEIEDHFSGNAIRFIKQVRAGPGLVKGGRSR